MMDQLLLENPFSLGRAQKQGALLAELNALTVAHDGKCSGYREILHAINGVTHAREIEDVPFIPVRLFKSFDLKSVAQQDVVRVLTSSGTTGQAVSRIALDSETSKLQSKALVRIVNDFLGKTRRPMVIVDYRGILQGGGSFGARVAAILGFSNFGRDHFWLLNEDFSADWNGLKAFLDRHRGTGVLVFGFTFMVWQHLLQAARAEKVELDFGDQSYLVHGGGWKKLLDLRVDDATFRSSLKSELGLGKVSDYYGMVEQTGSIFMQCEEGYLHTPSFADVVTRDMHSLAPLPFGQPGIIQVLSSLPRSYPGHSLLTEDVGVIHGEDDCKCGRKGRYLTIAGRLPKSEARGCSDVRASV